MHGAIPGFEFVRGDVRDRATVKQAVSGRDAVVHLAAIVGDPACARNPDLARAVNLDASLQLIEESQRPALSASSSLPPAATTAR